MKKGFTLLELIVVVIILGILATLAITQYTKLVEKGRTAEAKTILGQIRTAEAAYYQQYGGYTQTMVNLAIGNVPETCATTHYFSYTLNADSSATATRCTGAVSKTPGAATGANYTINVTYETGVFSGTAGYF